MILVDASVWIEHFRRGSDALADMLEAGLVLTHPFVVGELALGNLRNRAQVLDLLFDLPRVQVAATDEVLHFIDRHALAGRGIGYVDAHLLASVRLTGGSKLWTVDRRLNEVAAGIGLA